MGNNLIQVNSNLPATEKKALKDLLTLQAEYYKGLHVSSIKEAVLNTPNLPLSVIRKEITLAGARAILVIAINELVSFFNVGKTMNDVQVALTADLIIDRFYYLKLEEIKLCFRNAMASGKIYDRLVPYVHQNAAELVSNLVQLVGAGILSKETGSEESGYGKNNEWDRIMREYKEQQQADLLYQLKIKKNENKEGNAK